MQDYQNRKKVFYNHFLIVCIVFGVAIGMSACNPMSQGITLPFETIEQEDYSGTGVIYDYREPGMVIISRTEDIDSLKGLVTDKGIKLLQGLDYNQYFAVAVFQGRKGSTGYDVQVNRIGRIGKVVNVYALLNEPPPDIAVGAMETSPYILVKVNKGENWDPNMTFNLYSGETPVVTPSSPSSTPETILPQATLPRTPSAAALQALSYIAKRDGIPCGALTIYDDHPTEYPSLGRKFQVVTLVESRPDGQIYKLLVDLSNGKIEEDISALLKAEEQAYQSHYGKLDSSLYELLQKLRDGDMVAVAVWMAAGSQNTLTDVQQSAFATLAAEYPEAKATMENSGKPMDVADPTLARQIDAEYSSIVNDQMNARTRSLVTELEQRKFVVTVFDGMPSFTVVLPKRVILELNQRADVSAIYLAGGQSSP